MIHRRSPSILVLAACAGCTHPGARQWRMGDGDSIQVACNGNGTRYETGFLVRGDRLEGHAAFRSDLDPAEPPAVSVRGERIPCPAAP